MDCRVRCVNRWNLDGSVEWHDAQHVLFVRDRTARHGPKLVLHADDVINVQYSEEPQSEVLVRDAPTPILCCAENSMQPLPPGAEMIAWLRVVYIDASGTTPKDIRVLLVAAISRVASEARSVAKQLQTLSRKIFDAAFPCGAINFVALVSPVSGQGKGPQLWSKYAERTLAASPHTTTVIVTNRKGHAEEYVETATFAPHDVLVAVGGDGMVHEIVNGLAKRRRVPQPKIAIFPAGSACALAKNVGIEGPMQAAMALVHCRTLPIDLFTTEFKSLDAETQGQQQQSDAGRRRAAFLSVNTCFGAAVDIESEAYRWMGNARFTFYALKKLIHGVPKYSVAVRYKPVYGADIPAAFRVTSSPATTALNSKEAIAATCRAFDLTQEGTVHHVTQSLPRGDDVWNTIDQTEFVFLMICNMPWIAPDMCVAPHSHLSDRCLDIIYATDTVSRTELVQAMLAMENGTHINSNKVRCIKCRECEIRPLGGLISVDGEPYPLQELRASSESDLRVDVVRGSFRPSDEQLISSFSALP